MAFEGTRVSDLNVNNNSDDQGYTINNNCGIDEDALTFKNNNL